VDAALERLPDPVFLTIDVDVFDWSVIRSTGTPEPGGLLWDEGLYLLRKIFARKRVVGFDVVELSSDEADRNSPFAVAKLIYRMLGFKLASSVAQGLIGWPDKPAGCLFRYP
jgi:agmatinase